MRESNTKFNCGANHLRNVQPPPGGSLGQRCNISPGTVSTRMSAMSILSTRSLPLAFIPATVLLCACGGGGGSAPAPADTTPTPAAGWVRGQFSPASTFAALCVVPRTGIDPATQKAVSGPRRHGARRKELAAIVDQRSVSVVRGSHRIKTRPPLRPTAAYFDVLKTIGHHGVRQAQGSIPFHLPDGSLGSTVAVGRAAGYGANFVIIAARRRAMSSWPTPSPGPPPPSRRQALRAERKSSPWTASIWSTPTTRQASTP